MKLKFKYQEFQTTAVSAVADLFKGQRKRVDTFTIVNETQYNTDEGLGIRNVLNISDEKITENMREIQKRLSLPVSRDLTDNGELSRQFCIEMETGTGKTYVYTKTVFELHKLYGFTKFIIVVPSVAIREGVYKSSQITADHFAEMYDNTPINWFIYDSKKISQVRAFATSSGIEVMIINIDAFKKAENVINQSQDRLSGESAIKYVQDVNPIVIIDEPQSVDNTPKSKEAIASLNPLAVLRYSATHREKINLLYRLTPIDAYQMGLVKQISVSSNEIESDFNRAYIKLMSVSNTNGFTAKIEIDRLSKTGKIERKSVNIRTGADIFELSGGRELYRDCRVAGIDCTPGNEALEFDDGKFLKLGKAFGDFDENILKRAQIRRTIEAHFEKELRYTEKNIKVLSLFFIDRVEKYRNDEGEQGIYAKIFEECYEELLNLPKFQPLKNKFPANVSSVHNGYFSQDKKGNFKNTNGETADDFDAYNTIMKDKEWLLSFDCPLRFIWSHSALKEGWDNPNVFQICALIEQKSIFTARQKVGRGLRLCVNQDGERIDDKNINVLHVMANESFSEFAENLQKEIESETGVKFGILQLSLFNGLTYNETVEEEKKITGEQAEQILTYVKTKTSPEIKNETGIEVKSKTFENTPEIPDVAVKETAEKIISAVQMGAKIEDFTPEKVAEQTYTEVKTVEKTVSYNDASELMEHFVNKGYITKSGQIKDTMKAELEAGTLNLPEKFESAREKFENIISKANTKPVIHNAGKEVRVKLKKQMLISPEFMELWNKIKGRTTYRVKIDENLLKNKIIENLSKNEKIYQSRIVSKNAKIELEQSGVIIAGEWERVHDAQTDGKTENIRLLNFIRAVDEELFMSRKTAVEILQKSGRVRDFLNNPQKMTEIFIETVKSVLGSMEINGISYCRLAGAEYYVQEIFDADELTAYLDKNAVAVDNSLYDYVIYDSETVERPFAVALDSDPDVKFFFKIPDKFKIETPIGTYNPDWAVYLDKNGEEKLYFVLETKGVSGQIGFEELRTAEREKIKCGARHFEALGSGAVFRDTPVTKWEDVKKSI